MDRLADVKIDGAIEDAPSAPHTGDLAKEFREIVQLMHDPLTGPFPAAWPGIMTGGLQGIEGRKAGIPIPDPLPPVSGGFIHNIEAMTGRAEEGAGAAPDAFLMDFPPEGRLHQGIQPFLDSIDREALIWRGFEFF